MQWTLGTCVYCQLVRTPIALTCCLLYAMYIPLMRYCLSTPYTPLALLDHIPEVVSLRESETFTYSYDCEEGMVNWLCYYINEMEHPFIFSEVRYLPPFLQDGTTAANQECQSPDFSTFNITFTATTSMSGLLLFYANDSVCNIINSVGPRPFLFIVTAGRGVTA